MEGSDDPQAQYVTPSRKSRLPSPDSIGDHIHEDASSDSEHANNKRQRRRIVTPEQEESDAPAKGDDETIGPNRLRDDDDSEPSPKRPK